MSSAFRVNLAKSSRYNKVLASMPERAALTFASVEPLVSPTSERQSERKIQIGTHNRHFNRGSKFYNLASCKLNFRWPMDYLTAALAQMKKIAREGQIYRVNESELVSYLVLRGLQSQGGATCHVTKTLYLRSPLKNFSAK